MKQHIARIASNCFYHLRRLRQIRRVVGKEVTSQLVSVFVLSRLDYCNSLLAGISSTTVKPLQRVQNAAVRLVLTLVFVIMRHLDYNSSTGYLSSTELYLSYVCLCIQSTSDVHHGTWQTLCSHSWNPAVDPVLGPPTLLTTSNIVFNRSSVNAASVTLHGPAPWNSLPHSIKLITDTSRFKQLLKSHLFRIAFWHFVSALDNW